MELPMLVLAASIVFAAVILARRGAPDAAETGSVQAVRGLESRLDSASRGVATILGALDERRLREERMGESVARLERVMAGSFSRGRSGENLLAAALSEFPAEMVLRDFRIGGRVCEFAIRLPDGRVLPIDSKWAAVDLAEAAETTSPAEQEEHRRKVEKAVCNRLPEVAGYLDPSLTLPLAVMAVPDPVFACCRKAHAAARNLRIVIVPYSTAVPVAMSIWLMHQTYTRELDSELLALQLHEVASCLSAIEEKIEGHLARGLKAAENAMLDMRTLTSSARASLDAAGRAAPSGSEIHAN
ncbi:MAG: DNA recombination protein RmuC [Actinomycetota bacterium]